MTELTVHALLPVLLPVPQHTVMYNDELMTVGDATLLETLGHKDRYYV